MKNRHYLILLVLFLLLTINCSKNSQPVASNSPTPNMTNSKSENRHIDPLATTIADPISNEKALEFLYKNYNAQEEFSLWQPTDEEQKQMGLKKEHEDYKEWLNLQVSVILSKPFSQVDKERYLLVTQARPQKFDCPSCRPVINMVVFSKNASQWQVETRQFSQLGQYGKPAKANFIKVGPDKYGILFQEGSIYTPTDKEPSLSLFVYQDKGFKKVLFIPYSGVATKAYEPSDDKNNDGSIYEMIPGKTKDYYDLHLTTYGEKVNPDGSTLPINELTIYKFSKGEYALASTTNLMTEDTDDN